MTIVSHRDAPLFGLVKINAHAVTPGPPRRMCVRVYNNIIRVSVSVYIVRIMHYSFEKREESDSLFCDVRI